MTIMINNDNHFIPINLCFNISIRKDFEREQNRWYCRYARLIGIKNAEFKIKIAITLNFSIINLYLMKCCSVPSLI